MAVNSIWSLAESPRIELTKSVSPGEDPLQPVAFSCNQPGATFNMSNGLVDNHISTTGGVTVGDFYGGAKDAVMQMTGGIIVNNKARSLYG